MEQQIIPLNLKPYSKSLEGFSAFVTIVKALGMDSELIKESVKRASIKLNNNG